jgi:hypothetical protein
LFSKEEYNIYKNNIDLFSEFLNSSISFSKCLKTNEIKSEFNNDEFDVNDIDPRIVALISHSAGKRDEKE